MKSSIKQNELKKLGDELLKSGLSLKLQYTCKFNIGHSLLKKLLKEFNSSKSIQTIITI